MSRVSRFSGAPTTQGTVTLADYGVIRRGVKRVLPGALGEGQGTFLAPAHYWIYRMNEVFVGKIRSVLERRSSNRSRSEYAAAATRDAGDQQ